MCVKGEPTSENQPKTSLYHMHRNLKAKQIFISETGGSAGVNATNTYSVSR